MSVVGLKPTGREPAWVDEIHLDDVSVGYSGQLRGDHSQVWWGQPHSIADVDVRLARSLMPAADGLYIYSPDVIFIGGYELQIRGARRPPRCRWTCAISRN